MKHLFTTCAALLLALCGLSAQNFWQDVPETQVFLPGNAVTGDFPSTYRTLQLNMSGVRNFLRTAPEKGSAEALAGAMQFDLPLPDGRMETFKICNAPAMHPELAAKYPMIRSFAGVGVNDPTLTTRFGYGVNGFYAIVLSTGSAYLVTPYAQHQENYYIAFDVNDMPWGEGVDAPAQKFKYIPTEANSLVDPTNSGQGEEINLRDGGDGALVIHRTYRFGLTCTGEFGDNYGTVAGVLDAFNQATNVLNSVLERDGDFTLELVPDIEKLIFLNPATDPYTNASMGAALMGQFQNVLNDSLGLAGYDTGHGFTGPCSDVGGVVNGTVCAGTKGRGTTCFGNSSDLLVNTMQIAAHEIGHQFNGGHVWNNCPGVDSDQFHIGSAVEPGSGSTLLSYAGLCGSNNIQNSSDSYYSGKTVQEFWDYTHTGGGTFCGTTVTTSNHHPVVELPYSNGFYIPISTYFELDATASDADGDPLTYCWEQVDVPGPMSALGTPVGNAPSFRSYPPVTSSVRIFPRISAVVNGIGDNKEVLPSYNRDLTFRCTVRDNNVTESAGGITWQDVAFKATTTAGPFRVTMPNTNGITWEVGQYKEVVWDVADTDNSLVNCQKVNIYLSLDGGFTYPVTLLEDSPNDGSAFVTVPDNATQFARVKVKAADNIFFDISNVNFAIVPATQPGFALSPGAECERVCLPGSVTVEFETASLVNFSEPISLSINGLPTGATASFSSNPVTPGQPFSLTIDMDNVDFNGLVEMQLSASANGVATAERLISVLLLSNDFSGLQVVSPTDGASGMELLPSFQWTDLPNATSYDIDIATDPQFTNIVDGATNLTGNTFALTATLDENTVYYWRIKPRNECGDGDFRDAAAFRTVSQTCFSKTAVADVVISGTGLPYKTSVINVPESGIISDINITNVKANHSASGDVGLRLKGPAGDSITLMQAIPCNSPAVNLGFDDQAPLNVPCPPSTGLSYKPQQSLSAFNGQNSQGNWTLVFAVVNTLGEGGKFDSWGIEICGSVVPNDPFIVKNDTLRVPPNESRLVYSNHLVVEDSDQDANELLFTIVKNTEHGFVSRLGVQLGTGAQFAMGDIYSGKVQYTNTNPNAVYDYFTFTVQDGTGGFVGTPRFNIVTDPNAPTDGTAEIVPESDIVLFPNPASDLVTVEFAKQIKGKIEMAILNVQGQQMQVQRFENASEKMLLHTGGLPAGMYLVQMTTSQGVFAKKLVIE